MKTYTQIEIPFPVTETKPTKDEPTGEQEKTDD